MLSCLQPHTIGALVFPHSRSMPMQVMSVSAMQDGNGNVHPAAISDFTATEGTMTSESHCKADVTLNPQETYHGQLTVVDGAPVLSEAVCKYYPATVKLRLRNSRGTIPRHSRAVGRTNVSTKEMARKWRYPPYSVNGSRTYGRRTQRH